MMNCIRQIAAAEQPQISQLRITEFRRSREFSLRRPEQLEWNPWDDQHVVLAAWNASGQALSTMRAVSVFNGDEAAASMECTPPPQVVYPAIIFNSAATRKSHRGRGLNQVLRYHFLRAALSQDIHTLLSPIYEGAPRIDFMIELGYEFKYPERSWQTKLAPRCRRIVGMLHRSRMAHAMDFLLRHRGDAIRAYPFKGPPLKFYPGTPTPTSAAAKFSL